MKNVFMVADLYNSDKVGLYLFLWKLKVVQVDRSDVLTALLSIQDQATS